jgi:hypothetical protein
MTIWNKILWGFLFQCRQDYKNAYLSYLMAPTTTSLSSYFDAHNAYVQQLQATNGMLDQYHQETLPQLLQVSSLLRCDVMFSSRSFSICQSSQHHIPGDSNLQAILKCPISVIVCTSSSISENWSPLALGDFPVILSRVAVTAECVWIGDSIYRSLTTNSCNTIAISTFYRSLEHTVSVLSLLLDVSW